MTANGPVTFWEPSDKVRSDAVEATCTRRLSGHGKQSLQQKAQELADEASRGGEPDWYGTGGVVTEVEAQVCDLFGAEAAVLLPTGTMAQAIALRLHARDRDLPVVGMHPMSHPVLWEEDALTHLHGVEIREDPELQDLSGLAAVLVELPRRETGGHLMGFDELVTLSLRCADAGVALHLDGARLWQCGPAYAPKTLGEVVRLADTTYVSLYKDLGGAAGALLVCGHDQAVEVRSWRHRQGGTTFGLWPHVDALITSEECGVAKPGAAIFHCALGELGVAAHEAAMVGDSWANDIVGAANLVIQLPFRLEGAIAATIGAALAVAGLWVGVKYLVTDWLGASVEWIPYVSTSDVWFVTPFLVAIAIGLAAISSVVTLSRYTRV